MNPRFWQFPLLLVFLLFLSLPTHAQTIAEDEQSYLKGTYTRTKVIHNGARFMVYDFSRKETSKGKIRAKYFAQNANDKYRDWKEDRQVLFYCSGAFSESWDTDSPPLGICVDNGRIVNRNIDQSMDGLVIVYNGGLQAGGIAVVNMEKESVKVSQGEKASYNLRNQEERFRFLKWAEHHKATVFQTQLMYTKSYGPAFPTDQLEYGKKAERRFLAICMKKGTVHHIVIDHPDSDYLNRSAEHIIDYLTEAEDFTVYGLFNLDTGGKNIMRAFDEEGDELARSNESVNKATNLLIYYVE